MCGRYQFTAEQCAEIRQIVDAIQRKYGAEQWMPGEICPTAKAPVLVQEGAGAAPALMKWGYQLPGTLVINARAETAIERHTFKESVLHRRCVIPAKGFWEWNKSKEKFSFERPDAQVMFMAGCYDCFDGQERFVILTTEANSSVKPVHDRMPLILEQNELEDWVTDDGAAEYFMHKTPVLLEREAEYEQMSLF